MAYAMNRDIEQQTTMPTASESSAAFWQWCADYKRDKGREPVRAEAWHAAASRIPPPLVNHMKALGWIEEQGGRIVKADGSFPSYQNWIEAIKACITVASET